MEALEEALQKFVSVVDSLCVFAHNPNHGGACVRLVKRVQVLAQRGNDALIPTHTGGVGGVTVIS